MRGKQNSLSLGQKRPSIGIDLMGSDTSPGKILQDLLAVAEDLEESAQLVLFGTKQVLDRLANPQKVICVPTAEVISMEDDPLTAVRHKKQSSLSIGMQWLQKHRLDAFVSAGNTGALLAYAKMYLPMLPGIARPALITLIPTKNKTIAVLDVGANVNTKVEHLVQFTSMGVAFQKSRGIDSPTVGLLNIGSEATKGTPLLKETYQKLQLLNRECPLQSPIFLGNIEGRDVFQGNIDVLITDGFTGNVFLKTAEGLAAYILDELQKSLREECSHRLKEILSQLQERMHYAEYPGAILCGVEGLVVKCHGNLSSESLISSIKACIRLKEHAFLEKIKIQLALDAEKFKECTAERYACRKPTPLGVG